MAFAKHAVQKTPKGFGRGGNLSADERKYLRGPSAAYGEAGVPSQGFGTAGVQPKRNPAFTSAIGFNDWKAKHPKKGVTYTFDDSVETGDIDGDGISDRVVRRGDEIVAVNGWELRPSAAKFEYRPNYGLVNPDGSAGGPTDLWSSRASKRIATNTMFYDEDMKGIYARFGKAVVKPVFLMSAPGGKIAVNGTERTASWFYKGVAQALVGNRLDAMFIEQQADDIQARWPGIDPRDPAQYKIIVSALHRSKQYKQLLKRGLEAYAAGINSPDARDMVRQGLDAVLAANGKGYTAQGGPIVAPIPPPVSEAMGFQ